MQEVDLLIKQCLNGNAVAQKKLYMHFAAQMFGICIRYTKSTEDAQDILQEGFIKAFKNLHTYRNEGAFGGWLRRIMVNTALSYLKTHKTYSLDMLMEAEHLHPVQDSNMDIQIEAKEAVALIKQLPTGFQTIFNLYAIEGYTHVEIAKLLGISEGTSRSQYARARSVLMNWIKKNNKEYKKGGSYA